MTDSRFSTILVSLIEMTRATRKLDTFPSQNREQLNEIPYHELILLEIIILTKKFRQVGLVVVFYCSLRRLALTRNTGEYAEHGGSIHDQSKLNVSVKVGTLGMERRMKKAEKV